MTLRVLHVVRQYAPAVGGLETFVHLLAKNLHTQGCESRVVTLDRTFLKAEARLPARERIDGIDVERVPMIGHRRLFVPLVPEAALRDYDILHVHGIDGMFERIARCPQRTGQARIATSHGLFFHTPWMASLKRAYFGAVTRFAAQQYDHLIANSASDETHLRAIGKAVTQIPNGVEPLGDFTARGRDLLCLGRLSSHKRVDRLIAMMASPALAGDVLHIVGPDWDVPAETLRAQAVALGVADRVRLHGGVSQERLRGIAAQCGVFVSASEYEGFGMSLVEAASVGLIPVAEPNASFTQLVGDAGVGALTPFENPDTAANVVASTLASIDTAARDQARDFAHRYSWAHNAQATAALYRQVLDKRRASTALAS